ncbi:MAG: amidohydrolase [Halobacteriaceae archaeon]
MTTLDPHVHAWGPPTADHPWATGALVDAVAEFSVHPVYTADRLLADMDAADVDEAVVVGYPIYRWTDNAYTVEVAGAHDRLSGVVMLDPFAADAAATVREAMAAEGVLGFRLAPYCPYDEMWAAEDPGTDWLRDAIEETAVWEAARETGALVQLYVHHEQLDQVADLVAAYPEVTYAVDHFAQAGADVDPEEALSDLRALAEYDGVLVKASEASHRTEAGFPYEDVHGLLRWLLEAFGRERVVWGSDYPNVSDVATYAEAVEWVEAVDFLSASDREWLTGRAFRRAVSGL